MSAPELLGRVALVTGGSRGLGRAIAMGLAEAGATVIVTSRTVEACLDVATQITEATGVTAHASTLDMADWQSIEPAVGRLAQEHGRLDVVVNNAGIATSATSALAVTEALLDTTLDVNLKGPFRLMAVAGARMRDAGGGSIINISSIGAERPSPAQAVYAASKSGLNTLTRAFAQEYAPTVRVNCVMAGAFATDTASCWDEACIDEIVDRLPSGRLGEPAELAALVVHLASDRASYTTGALIAVDGGRMAVY